MRAFRSRGLKERPSRPILSGEFLNPSCMRIIFTSGSQSVWICISNMPGSYSKCVVLKIAVSRFFYVLPDWSCLSMLLFSRPAHRDT